MTERYTFFMFCAAVQYRDAMRAHGTARVLFEMLKGFRVYVVEFTPHARGTRAERGCDVR